MENFSVLMSLYIKEKPESLKECLTSLLNQSVLADEWIIVKDGALTNELEDVIQSFIQENPNLIKIVPLEKNLGLGLALREGIMHCSNELIARMDTDDIALPNRFELQLAAFDEDHELGIVGGQIAEFEGNIDHIISYRNVPTTCSEIYKYQKNRSAFNHMTVMFKKSIVLQSGNYQNVPLMEDDMLWVNMMLCKVKAINLNEILVYARTGLSMIERRGGLKYFIKYKRARRKIYDTGYIGFHTYLYSVTIQLFVCILPKKLRLFVFKNVLR